MSSNRRTGRDGDGIPAIAWRRFSDLMADQTPSPPRLAEVRQGVTCGKTFVRKATMRGKPHLIRRRLRRLHPPHYFLSPLLSRRLLLPALVAVVSRGVHSPPWRGRCVCQCSHWPPIVRSWFGRGTSEGNKSHASPCNFCPNPFLSPSSARRLRRAFGADPHATGARLVHNAAALACRRGDVRSGDALTHDGVCRQAQLKCICKRGR